MKTFNAEYNINACLENKEYNNVMLLLLPYLRNVRTSSTYIFITIEESCLVVL